METKVSEIMTKQVISVSPETTLDKATELMTENDISGLPVEDENNKLVGIITERDIIKFSSSTHVIPLISTSGWISPHTDVTNIASFRQGVELLTNTKVNNVMNSNVKYVKEDTPINEVAKIMEKNRINRIPIVDNDKKLCGIITRQDLVNYIAEKV